MIRHGWVGGIGIIAVVLFAIGWFAGRGVGLCPGECVVGDPFLCRFFVRYWPGYVVGSGLAVAAWLLLKRFGR